MSNDIKPAGDHLASRRWARRLLATSALAGLAFAAPATAQDVVINDGVVSNAGAPAVDVNILSGDIFVSLLAASTTGDDAPAIQLTTFNGESSLFVDGDVFSNGDASIAIRANASDNIQIVVAGDIGTLGRDSLGVIAVSESGDIDMSLSGLVTTSGQNAGAVSAMAFGGDIYIKTANIQTFGNAATGIDATALDGAVRVNAGSVITMGDFSSAVSLAGEFVDFEAFELIATGGDRSSGILANGQGVIIDFVDVSTAGEFSIGVGVSVRDGALELGGGSVVTTGDDATAVEIIGENSVLTVQVDHVEARGFGSSGVEVKAFNSDLIAEIGTIAVSGDGAEAGLSIESDGGAIGLQVEDVVTSGFGVHGLDVRLAPRAGAAGDASRHGGVTINAGSIGTSGDQAVGFNVEIDSNLLGDGTAGPITLSAQTISTFGEEASGLLLLDQAGDTAVSITVDDIATLGNRSFGVAANVGASDITVGAAGIVATSGAFSDAIRLVSLGDINVAAAMVRTLGNGAEGVHVTNRWTAGKADTSRFVQVLADDVQTRGNDASAIRVSSESADVTVRVGDVETFGRLSDGIEVLTGTGDIAVSTTGQIHTHGAWGDGISARTDSGSINILASDVVAEGFNSFGVVATSDEGGDISIVQLGDIISTGENGGGVAGIAFWNPIEGGSSGTVNLSISGNIDVVGPLNTVDPDFPVRGNAVMVHGETTTVSIAEGARVSAQNGYAYLALDRTIQGPDGAVETAGEDRLNLFGAIAGDVRFGNGDDWFLISGPGADISELGFVDGGSGTDTLQIGRWSGSLAASQFDSFEELIVVESSSLTLHGDWRFEQVTLSDSILSLANGASLAGDVIANEVGELAAIDFANPGASSAMLDGDIFIAGGQLILGLLDPEGFSPEGNDEAIITGSITGDVLVGLDVGIGSGQIAEADALFVGGGVSGHVTVVLTPYAASGDGIAGPLLTFGGPVESITLGDGPLSWGGQVFDLEIGAAPAASAASASSAPASTGVSVSLASTGFTSSGAAAVALPAVFDGLDSSLATSLLVHRSLASKAPTFWAQAVYDDFDGAVDGFGYGGEQTGVVLGGDLPVTPSLTASLMLQSSQAEFDIDQTGFGRSALDIDTFAVGASLNWSPVEANVYMDFGAWLTDRDIEFAGQTIRGQGSVLSAEVGSLLSLGEATEIQPLLQIVWSHAQIDSFTDDTTGNEMQPGDSASLRVRAGAILRHKLGETWSLSPWPITTGATRAEPSSPAVTPTMRDCPDWPANSAWVSAASSMHGPCLDCCPAGRLGPMRRPARSAAVSEPADASRRRSTPINTSR